MRLKYIIIFMLLCYSFQAIAQDSAVQPAYRTEYKITILDTVALASMSGKVIAQNSLKPRVAEMKQGTPEARSTMTGEKTQASKVNPAVSETNVVQKEKEEDINYPALVPNQTVVVSNQSIHSQGKPENAKESSEIQDEENDIDNVKSSEPELCFPITKDFFYNVYDYTIYVEDVTVINKYKPLFDKYELVYSGYVWEFLLRDIIKEAAPDLAKYVIMRSDNKRVLIKVIQRQEVSNFPGYLCKYLTNLSRFEASLRKVNRKNVPKY